MLLIRFITTGNCPVLTPAERYFRSALETTHPVEATLHVLFFAHYNTISLVKCKARRKARRKAQKKQPAEPQPGNFPIFEKFCAL